MSQHPASLPSGLNIDITGANSIYDYALARLGRTAPALTEILSILEANVNPALTAFGFAAADLMKKYYWAGEVVEVFPSLVIGAAVDTVEQNMGWTDTVTVQVTIAWQVALDRFTREKVFDISNVIRAILLTPSVRANYWDQQGRKLWTQLFPRADREASPGGADWNNYFGRIVQFELWQMPGPDNNLWSDRAPA